MPLFPSLSINVPIRIPLFSLLSLYFLILILYTYTIVIARSIFACCPVTSLPCQFTLSTLLIHLITLPSSRFDGLYISFNSITGITIITESQIIMIIMMMVITESIITSLLLPQIKMRSLQSIRYPHQDHQEVLFERNKSDYINCNHSSQSLIYPLIPSS